MKVFTNKDGINPESELYRAPHYKAVANPDYDPEIEGSEKTIQELVPHYEARSYTEMPDNTDLSKYIVDGGVLRLMTSEELLAIANEETAEGIKAQIVALELTVTDRRSREANLTAEGKAWLQNVDDQIAALRLQIAALRANL